MVTLSAAFTFLTSRQISPLVTILWSVTLIWTSVVVAPASYTELHPGRSCSPHILSPPLSGRSFVDTNGGAAAKKAEQNWLIHTLTDFTLPSVKPWVQCIADKLSIEVQDTPLSGLLAPDKDGVSVQQSSARDRMGVIQSFWATPAIPQFSPHRFSVIALREPMARAVDFWNSACRKKKDCNLSLVQWTRLFHYNTFTAQLSLPPNCMNNSPHKTEWFQIGSVLPNATNSTSSWLTDQHLETALSNLLNFDAVLFPLSRLSFDDTNSERFDDPPSRRDPFATLERKYLAPCHLNPQYERPHTLRIKAEEYEELEQILAADRELYRQAYFRAFGEYPHIDHSTMINSPPKGWKPILFFHMHKAGGTIMCKLMQQTSSITPYQSQHNCNIFGMGPRVTTTCDESTYFTEVQCPTWRAALRYPIMMGALEIPFPSGKLCTDDFRHITMLREPMSRIASHFSFHFWNEESVLDLIEMTLAGESPPLYLSGMGSGRGLCMPLLFYSLSAVDNYYIRMLLGWPVFKLPFGAIT